MMEEEADELTCIFDNVEQLLPPTTTSRQKCLTCTRPQSVCLCTSLPPLPPTTHTLIIVQHPHQLHNPLSTIPILTQILPKITTFKLVSRRLRLGLSPLLDSLYHSSPNYSSCLYLFPPTASCPAIPLSQLFDGFPGGKFVSSVERNGFERNPDGEIASFEENNGNLEKHIGSIEGRFGNLEVGIEKVGSEDRTIESKLGYLDSKIDVLDKEIGDLDRKILNLESQIRNLEEKSGDLEQKEGDFEDKIENLEEKSEFKGRVLVVFDGTWKHAKEMVNASEEFLSNFAVRVCLDDLDESEEGGCIFDDSGLILRKEPYKGCVSTAEAVARAMRVIEPNGIEIERRLLCMLSEMVRLQKCFLNKPIKCRPKLLRKGKRKEDGKEYKRESIKAQWKS